MYMYSTYDVLCTVLVVFCTVLVSCVPIPGYVACVYCIEPTIHDATCCKVEVVFLGATC